MIVTPFITLAAYSLFGFFNAIAVLRVIFKPIKPGVIFWEIDELIAKKLYRRLYLVVIIFFISALMYLIVAAQGLPESANVISLGVLIIVGVVNLIWAVFLFRKVRGFLQYQWLRIAIYVVLISVVGLYWFGYRNLALTLLWYLVGTSIALTIVRLFSHLLNELFDSFDKGVYVWQQKTRSFINIKPDETVPGMIWARVASTILLWMIFMMFIRIGVSATTANFLQDTNLH